MTKTHFLCSPDSAMRRCRALSPSSGHHGRPGPSAAQSVEEGCTLAPGTVRMEIAVQDVRWYVHLKYTHTYTHTLALKPPARL